MKPFLSDERGQDAWIFDELLDGKDGESDAYTRDIANPKPGEESENNEKDGKNS